MTDDYTPPPRTHTETAEFCRLLDVPFIRWHRGTFQALHIPPGSDLATYRGVNVTGNAAARARDIPTDGGERVTPIPQRPTSARQPDPVAERPRRVRADTPTPRASMR